MTEDCIFCIRIMNFLLKDTGKERSQSKNTRASLARFKINTPHTTSLFAFS